MSKRKLPEKIKCAGDGMCLTEASKGKKIAYKCCVPMPCITCGRDYPQWFLHLTENIGECKGCDYTRWSKEQTKIKQAAKRQEKLKQPHAAAALIGTHCF